MQGILRLTATAAFGGLVLLGCGGGGGGSDSPKDDVIVTTCSPTGDKPEASGAVTNRTTKTSGYAFRVRFLNEAGKEVSQGAGTVAKVEPQVTATWVVQGATAANGPLTCRVDNIVRTEVP